MRTMWSAADFVYPDSPSGPPLLRCKKARTAPGFPPNLHFDRCVFAEIFVGRAFNRDGKVPARRTGFNR